MIRFATLLVLASALAMGCNRPPSAAQEKPQASAQPPSPSEPTAKPLEIADSAPTQDTNPKAGTETRYLAIQIFTSSPDPDFAVNGEGLKPLAGLPDRATLRSFIEGIKKRIGTVGDARTHLAVVLGPLSFDHNDADVARFVAMAFSLALETDVAVGFHIDDSIFWANRKDLWTDPKNVEALDWNGTPCTGRRLDWGPQPSAAPPQMCFNSKAILEEVRKRSTVLGTAIQAGVKQLRQRNKPELFAGVIAGWETMIGQDFKTNAYLGYRALLNRGFSREHPPQDIDAEREKVVREFIGHWTQGLAEAGAPTNKIYSHTAFLARRSFNPSDNKDLTYSRQNHFATASAAFGNYHRPGFSTYPQPGQFDEIYAELAKHKQAGWASSEGTNLQLGSGPGQSGMNMETYLAHMFNHGAALVNVFGWGIGGDAGKSNEFRLVAEGDESLNAYRQFLRGGKLVEAATVSSYMERLPAKIHRIQKELPAWIRKTGRQAEAEPLMKQLDAAMKAKDFNAAERTADSILTLISSH